MLLRRLAVFAGGWTLEAAEGVCAGGGIDEAEVLDLLTHLVDKSLVAMDADGSRYRLLETVREYALARLDESGEGMEARTRHLEHYVAFGEKAKHAFYGPAQADMLARLDLERENILAAHVWAAHEPPGGELGLRLAYSVGPYWYARGQPDLGRRLNEEALARPGAYARSAARARTLFEAGWQCCHLGRYEEAARWLEESLAIGRELGDRAHVARVLQPLGLAAFGRGDVDASRTYMEEAADLARESGDKRELAAALNGLAQLHRVEGELDAAEPLYDRVVRLARESGDSEAIAIGLLNLAMVSIGRGTGDRARPMLIEVVTIALEIGSRPVGQSALDVSAGYGAWLGEWERAARFFGAADAQAVEIGLQRDPTDESFLMPLIDRARVELGAEGFALAERAGRALTYEQSVGEARAWLARAP